MNFFDDSLISAVNQYGDNKFTLGIEQNKNHWPWMRLPCWHPVVPEKIWFFVSVTVGMKKGLISDDSFTAITNMSWRYLGHPDGMTLPARILCDGENVDGKAHITGTAEDSSGNPLFTISGEGVVFRNRDFKAWRKQAKQSVTLGHNEQEPFIFVEPREVGSAMDNAVLVGPLKEVGKGFQCTAYIDKDNGFYPGHAYHTGSQDHVNAAQLLDSCYQFSHLIRCSQRRWRANMPPIFCLGGSANFRNYVELGFPFRLQYTGSILEPGEEQISFDLYQRGALCACMTLHLAS